MAWVRRIVPKTTQFVLNSVFEVLIDELSTPGHVFNPGPLPRWFANEGLVVELQELTSGTALDVLVLQLALDPAALVAELSEFFGASRASLGQPLLADTGRVAERCQRVL